nr:PREDICTED: RING finger protein PFF0165c-like isoform X2 [Linepithema humile]
MQRSRNFTTSDKNSLLDIIFLYRHIIENKECNNNGILKKDETWANVTKEFNARNTIQRTEKNLKYLWDNIKKETRKYCATFKREIYKTGGGVSNLEKNMLYERAKEIMGETATNGLLNPYDSDFIYNKENIITVDDILQDTNDESNSTEHLIKNKEINDWTIWNSKKLKSQISFPLQNKEEDIPTTSTCTIGKKRKHDEISQCNKISKLKNTEIACNKKANIEEKEMYEMETLKNKLETEKLKVELLKLSIEKEKILIEKEKLIKQKIEEQEVISLE